MKHNDVLTKELERVDVTNEIKEKCYKKTKEYENVLQKVEKEKSIYYITFADGFTAFGEKTRKARRVTEVQWYTKVATEEKEKGFDLETTLKEFKQNGIWFEGHQIPEYIDTIKSVKAKIERNNNEQKHIIKV